MPRRLVPAVLLALLVLPLAGLPGLAADGPGPLEWARRLVSGVTPETNLYASRPTVVTWAGVNGAAETRNRSVCSALVAHLLMQTYGYRAADFASWLGGRFPRAAGFHDAIAAGRGFDPVHRVEDIRPAGQTDRPPRPPRRRAGRGVRRRRRRAGRLAVAASFTTPGAAPAA